jgi:hypothetical protein
LLTSSGTALVRLAGMNRRPIHTALVATVAALAVAATTTGAVGDEARAIEVRCQERAFG